MLKHWKPYIVGAFTMFIVLIGFYVFFVDPKESTMHSSPKSIQANIPSDSVTITPLPTLRIIRGERVPFEGKVELKQAIAGLFAQDLVVVNFQVTGENSEKSFIKIVWENGEVEKLYPGTTNKIFSPSRRAVEITVVGYSIHERRLFKDSNRKGTLTWEIRYDPVENSPVKP
ncbi:hypothetical protein [Dendrosporobacter sp. 1207_IL3150]|uniref:hypothetical protein n=1 Tax=Dendrosporobacter sp. 1207_IL3150 TaxID=3084054 RepID=UPI002FD8CC0F